MSVEDHLVRPGDAIRLRCGPYAGALGTVVSVHPDANHAAENSLVMIKLLSGRINSCYMSNLEKLPLRPEGGSAGAVERGGNT